MKYEVIRIGNTYSRDGGIDFIALPKSSPFPFLIAVQAKYHKGGKPVGPSVIREFRDVIAHQRIDIGVVVTNTRFTPTAQWVANQMPHIIRLRDLEALSRWLRNEFNDDDVWKDIPSELQLAPDLTISIPQFLRRD